MMDSDQKKKDVPVSKCGHVGTAKDLTFNDLIALKSKNCHICGFGRANRWLCLVDGCHTVSCGSKHKDHSFQHSQENDHPLQLHVNNWKIWCNVCQTQVFSNCNIPGWKMGEEVLSGRGLEKLKQAEKMSLSQKSNAPQEAVSRAEILEQGRPYRDRERPSARVEFTDSDERDELHPRGLTGLRNLGNTCYMNAALQALSNCAPFAEFFCDFPVCPKTAPGLSLRLRQLFLILWSQKRSGCVLPSDLLQGIRQAFPTFRGFQQQDSQEFLRCFLDQIHQELKETVYELEQPGDTASGRSSPSTSSASGSERYETADSGWSSDQERKRKTSSMKFRKRNQSESRERFQDARQDTSPVRKKRVQRSRKLASSVPKMKAVSYRSIITDVFDGRILSKVQCLTCSHISETRETFQDLSLPIPTREQLDRIRMASGSSEAGRKQPNQSWLWWVMGGWMWKALSGVSSFMYDWFLGPDLTLQDSLAAFFTPDDLRGDDMYSCDKCKKLRNGVKSCRLLALPEVLCVHLKRFRHELMFSSKVTSRVKFPLDKLDLAPFLDSDTDADGTNYHLVAVICHYGGAEGGHYTAYCLNRVNERWYEFDDSCVTEVSPAQVLSAEAYVFFYQKIESVECLAFRAIVHNYLARAQLTPGIGLKYYISSQWVCRLNTFAEPGPITNYDFLCPHGGIAPAKVQVLPDLYAEVPSDVWKTLYNRFQGGPVCTSLCHCLPCHQEDMRLRRRRKEETEAYKRLDFEMNTDTRPRLHWDYRLIAVKWLEQWEAFVCGHVDEAAGPIDNRCLVGVQQDGQKVFRRGSNYHRISRDLWEYFYQIYGGGPEVYVTYGLQPTPEQVLAHEHEEAARRSLEESEDPPDEDFQDPSFPSGDELTPNDES